jgi:hypothetical protein
VYAVILSAFNGHLAKQGLVAKKAINKTNAKYLFANIAVPLAAKHN